MIVVDRSLNTGRYYTKFSEPGLLADAVRSAVPVRIKHMLPYLNVMTRINHGQMSDLNTWFTSDKQGVDCYVHLYVRTITTFSDDAIELRIETKPISGPSLTGTGEYALVGKWDIYNEWDLGLILDEVYETWFRAMGLTLDLEED